MPFDTFMSQHREQRRRHWDCVHGTSGLWTKTAAGYHRRIRRVFQTLVSPGARVLEIGCGRGDLLAALAPGLGVGVDVSSVAVSHARRAHPECKFVQSDAQALPFTESDFDYIILSDLLNDLWDVQGVFEEVKRLAKPDARIIVNVYSRLWEHPLRAAKRLGLSRPLLEQNWLTVADVISLLRLSGLQPIRSWSEVLVPVRLPFVEGFANRYLVRSWPFHLAALSNLVVARPEPRPREVAPKVSVIVPARNEAGRVAEILDRVPEMGGGTEIVFVEGHSRDNTYDAIRSAMAARRGRAIKLFQQTGEGKGDAVRLGFEKSTGDILMILDADLTVAPEDLPRFYEALRSGRAELANGVRLVYPMQDRAMRMANLVANKGFGILFSWILGQPVKDTLCGTKVLWRNDYEEIARNRSYFGDFDPFGDFDLLFGAAKTNRQIVDIPVRYRERTYGTTNIRRWKHGLILLRMALVGARRLRFV